MKNYNQTEIQKRLISLSDEDFAQTIKNNFPEFFRTDGKNVFFGISIGAGWRPVLWELCKKIQLLRGPHNFFFERIEEVFSGAKFHYGLEAVSEDLCGMISDLVSEYEKKCYNICALTGEYYEEKIVQGGTVYHVCLESFKKLYGGYRNVEMAEECVEKQRLADRAKRLMFYLDLERTKNILAQIEEFSA